MLDPLRPLKVIHGDITVTTPGFVIRDADIFGRLIIRAAGVHVINSRIRGVREGQAGWPTGPTMYRPLIDARHPACRDLLVKGCHLEPDSPSPYWEAGISGINFSLYDSLVARTVDGVRCNGGSQAPGPAQVWVTGNVIGWLAYFRADAPGVVHPSDTETHNDVIHIEGTDGVSIWDNDLHGVWAQGWGDEPAWAPSLTTNDCQVLQVNNRSGEPARNIVFRRNRIHGGRIPVNLGGAAKVDAGHKILTAHQNIFFGDAGIAGQTILADVSWAGQAGLDCGEGTPLANRLFDLDGPEITVRRNG